MDSNNLPLSNDGQINEVNTDNKQKNLRILTIVILALEPIIILLMTVGLINALGSQFSTSDTTLLDRIDESLFGLSCISFPILGIIGVVLGSIGHRSKSWPGYKGIFAWSIASFILFGSCYFLLILGLLGS